MGKIDKTRRHRLCIEAVDPRTGESLAVFFSQEKLLAVAKRSSGQIKEAAFCVPAVLQKPTAVFRGLLREEDEPKGGLASGWLCYCGVPDVAYDETGQERDPWSNEVFLVFVNEEMVVYNWYWAPRSFENPDLPEDAQVRFKDRLL